MGNFQGGSIKAGGKIKAKRIFTNLAYVGADDPELVRAALKAIKGFRPGDVEATGDIESDLISTGFYVETTHLDPGNPRREAFVAELRELRRLLDEMEQEPEATDATSTAGEAVDEAIAEAEKDEPDGATVVERARSAVKALSDIGDAAEGVEKAGKVASKALPLALALYQAAKMLF